MTSRIWTTVLFVFLFGAPLFGQCPTCPTSDEAAVQALLDAAAAAGGGVVQLEARVYQICDPLIVGSNTHLRGAGRGATIIRGSTTNPGLIVENSFVGASVASVATTNVTVSDLTIDHATCDRNANGISFLPASTGGDSQAYDGTPVTNGLIERVEVLGAPQYHSYMIWNMRGEHVKILNNWVDGRATAISDQEGIESFGGRDVLISGNTVKNIGFACLNVGSAGLFDSGTAGVTMTNNHLTGCEVGVHLGTAMSPSNEPMQQLYTRVVGNVVVSPRSVGIDVAVVPGTIEGDLIIANNTVRDIDTDGAIGIWLRSSGGTVDSSAVVANTIQGNHVENIRGNNAHGIRLTMYPDARIIDNTITGTDNGAIYTVDSDDVEIRGNRIENAGIVPIQMYASTSAGFHRFLIERNTIRDWAVGNNGILVNGGKVGVIRDNVLTRSDTSKPIPIKVTAGSCGVTVADNVPWYLPSWLRLSVPACP